MADKPTNDDFLEQWVAEESAQEAEDISEISQSPFFQLPSVLQNTVIKRCFAAVGLLIVGICVAITYHSETSLLFLLLGLWFALSACSTVVDWHNKKITEMILVCVSCSRKRLRKHSCVLMRTNDDTPQYFTFNIPTNSEKEFNVGVPYLIYTHTSSPNTLLAWMEL